MTMCWALPFPIPHSPTPAPPHAFRSRYPLPRPRRPVLAVVAARVEADRGLLRRIDPRDVQDRRALAPDHRGRWRIRLAVGDHARLPRAGELRLGHPTPRASRPGTVPRHGTGPDPAACHPP